MAILTPTQLRERADVLANETDDLLEALVSEFTDIVDDYRGTCYDERTATETHYIAIGRTSLWLAHRPVHAINSITVDGATLATTDVTLERADGVLRDWLFNTSATYTITYTYGAGARTVTDGVTTSGSTSVTSATALFDGNDHAQPITGTGIPTGTTISTTISSTSGTSSATLSAAATASGTGVTLTIGEAPKAVQRACVEYVRACVLSDRSGVPRDVIGQSFEGTYTRYSTPDKDAGRPTGYLEVDRLLNALPDNRRLID